MNTHPWIKSYPPGVHWDAPLPVSPVQQILEDAAARVWAVQFHPEVGHTLHGREILENFLFRICGVTASWTMAGFRQEKVAAIRRQAPTGAVICALSGGVDSSVLLALAANLGVGLLKLAAGLITGSAALLSEAAHSAGDCTTEIFQ